MISTLESKQETNLAGSLGLVSHGFHPLLAHFLISSCQKKSGKESVVSFPVGHQWGKWLDPFSTYLDLLCLTQEILLSSISRRSNGNSENVNDVNM